MQQNDAIARLLAMQIVYASLVQDTLLTVDFNMVFHDYAQLKYMFDEEDLELFADMNDEAINKPLAIKIVKGVQKDFNQIQDLVSSSIQASNSKADNHLINAAVFCSVWELLYNDAQSGTEIVNEWKSVADSIMPNKYLTRFLNILKKQKENLRAIED